MSLSKLQRKEKGLDSKKRSMLCWIVSKGSLPLVRRPPTVPSELTPVEAFDEKKMSSLLLKYRHGVQFRIVEFEFIVEMRTVK